MDPARNVGDPAASPGAVLGVPLLLREKVIGVLFAANRRERPFADAEVALLISLATHAAIAIETASLFAEVGAHSDLMERAANAADPHGKQHRRREAR
ncbi:GAF domain-containing protein [Micromonospora purpureochromogenes]|uniref:GAF domain-containing protein n=1 Tax=Micromonospora purpureochromogenes TaxID=47872 RepID=UPI003F4D2213